MYTSCRVLYVFLSRMWALRWTRMAPWTSVWRSPSKERAVCQAPARGSAPQTLLHPPLLPFTMEAVGWPHQTSATPTSRKSGRGLWITPNPTARGRRKWMRLVWQSEPSNTQYFTEYYSQRKYCNINNNRQNPPRSLLIKKLLFTLLCLTCLFPVPLSSFYYSFIPLKRESYCTVKTLHCASEVVCQVHCTILALAYANFSSFELFQKKYKGPWILIFYEDSLHLETSLVYKE